MLWMVGALFLISMFCSAMIPITCGLYMQPFWSSETGVEGTCQVLSGKPDLTQTKAFFKVLLSLTTTSSDFAGVEWALLHAGTADISIVFAAGAVPSNMTLP